MVESCPITVWSNIWMPFEYCTKFSLVFRPPFEYRTSIQISTIQILSVSYLPNPAARKRHHHLRRCLRVTRFLSVTLERRQEVTGTRHVSFEARDKRRCCCCWHAFCRGCNKSIKVFELRKCKITVIDPPCLIKTNLFWVKYSGGSKTERVRISDGRYSIEPTIRKPNRSKIECKMAAMNRPSENRLA